MEIQTIGEPVRMVAEFSAGAARPIRFCWSGRTYAVTAVNGQWVDRNGARYRLCYSVQAEGQTWYVHFDSVAVQWWVDQVIVD